MNKSIIGTFVKIKVANEDGRKKVVPKNFEEECEIRSFEIIGSYRLHKEMEPYYMVVVDSDMIGWTVSKSHMLYYDLNEKYLNHRFYDVNEDFFV